MKYLILFIAILASLVSPAQNPKPSCSPAPSWIIPVLFDKSEKVPLNQVEQGYYYLLWDSQVDVASETSYRHYCEKIVSDAGVQNASEITIDFEPTYQELLFHSVYIWRNGEKINKLDLDKIKVIQQETDLKRHIYNGTLSAVLVLDDVRKDDVIEFEYSVKGFNPIFNGIFFDYFTAQYTVPISRLSYTLHAPASRKLYFKNYKTNIQPKIDQRNGNNIYRWEQEKLEGLIVNDYLPSWYDAYPYIEITEFSSWKALNDWAMKLYPVSQDLDPELEKKIDEIRAAHKDKKDQLVEALHFVQNEVRYMGIEMGVNSHKPTSPSKVFAQRFGDCKDKSLLLCNMFTALGIEAHPVLIYSRGGNDLGRCLPAPHNFDHLTVQAKLDGNTYWFDPTISYQGGTLGNIMYPDYRKGLVITEGTTGLTDISNHEQGLVSIHELFEISDYSGDARLTVTTTYSGGEADQMRYDIASRSQAEMEESYLNFYAKEYNSIKKEKAWEITDDREKNELIVREHYLIKDLWEAKEEDGQKQQSANFNARVLQSYLTAPSDYKRSMPLGIRFPVNVTELIEVITPDDWTITDESGRVEDSTMLFTYKRSGIRNDVKLLYTYQAKADFVPAEKIKAYISNIDKLQDKLFYSLYWTEGQIKQKHETHANWALVLFFIFFSGVMVYGVRRANLIDIPAAVETFGYYIPVKGPLHLIRILLFISLVFHFVQAAALMRFFDLADWLDYTSPAGKYFDGGWAPYFIFKMLSGTFLTAYSVLLLILFANRRSSFPKLFIIFLAAAVVLAAVNYLLSLYFSDLPGAGGSSSLIVLSLIVVVAAVCTHYTIVSEQVKATFTITRNRKQTWP